MNQNTHSLLARYQPWRKVVEPGFWIGFFCLQAVMNSWTVWLDLGRSGQIHPYWQPAVWEWSSNLVLLGLMPVLLRFERQFPLQIAHIRRNLPWHLAATIIFCLLHVGLMVLLRKLAYYSQGESYQFGLSGRELCYEYLKDVRAYFALLLVVNFYRLVLLRWQGEASLLAEPDEGPAVEPIERPERFLVRKLGKEFLLPALEIECIQAWGNYVNLRVRAHDYPLRATMAAIEQRLDPKRFVRVHRSHIVNLDFVAEIEPLESGDARVKLHSGQYVPVSRRYRDALRA
ncbi:LytTR family DNA-binding domain-containing protein [Chitinimonas sp.]|uniref:LytTR family DNA-binding domain-containing protein n=1 Tax=Chitinimonas sp. TaxID=1934313 RepID=UPI0035B46FAC